MRRSLLVVVPLAICAAATVGLSDGPIASAQDPDEPPARTIWLRDCAWCHGSDAGGTNVGPSLDGVGAASIHFYLSTGRMPIDSPRANVERGPRAYDEETIEDLVAYVTTLVDGPAVPNVRPERGDLGHGAELYILNCAACHSTTGIGAALTSGEIAPAIGAATATEIAASMIVGPGEMPILAPPLTDHDVDSITRYVLSLQDPTDRGGAGLFNFGPVAEGAVAWIIGLGAFVVLIRWLGTRTSEDHVP